MFGPVVSETPVLIPDVITHIFTFLGISDRLSCRLTSREFLSCTPSPWRLAGDVLEGSNSFDVSSCCSAKLSFTASPERPFDDVFNKARAAAIACLSDDSEYNDCKNWVWAGDAEEAANKEVSRAFARRDPRRKPAYKELMTRVSKRSYSILDDWINTGPYSPSAVRTPEADRLRQLLDFSQAAKERLSECHENSMNSALNLERGSLRRWSNGGDGEGHNAWYEHAYEKRPCSHHFIHELASLNIAATELFQKKRPVRYIHPDKDSKLHRHWECYSVYHFETDYMKADGSLGINCGGGSSFSREMSSCYLDGPFEKNSRYGGDGVFVGTSVKPCSKEHFEYLLQRPSTLKPLATTFGDEMCDIFFDPISRTRKNSEEIWDMITSIDDDFDTSDDDDDEEDEGQDSQPIRDGEEVGGGSQPIHDSEEG